ncbi:MAG: hypothetical protein LBF80_05600 [Spirochaetaceae bacterium]|nr:hypothetical protein [Spirochaetaceae bacterium]
MKTTKYSISNGKAAAGKALSDLYNSGAGALYGADFSKSTEIRIILTKTVVEKGQPSKGVFMNARIRPMVLRLLFLICGFLVFVACEENSIANENPLNQDATGETDETDTADKAIHDIDLTGFIPVPGLEVSPVTSFSAMYYDAALKWRVAKAEDVNASVDEKDMPIEVFQPYTSYTVFVTLTRSSSDIEFSASVNVTHAQAGHATFTGGGDSVSGFISFPPYIHDIDLTDYIPVPGPEVSPVTSFSTSSYNAAVEWRVVEAEDVNASVDEDEDMPIEVFQPYTSYTVFVTLTRSSSDIEFPASVNVIHAQGGLITFNGGGDSVSGVISFPPYILGADPGQPAIVALFSGNSSVAMDSAIDLIKAAVVGQSALFIQLKLGNEQVTFGANDLGTEGLTLNNENSPAEVIIDGGGRVIDLTGSPSGNPLITVGEGITLTLRNITFKGLNDGNGDVSNNNVSLIKVTTGGHFILGTGAVIRDNATSGGYGGGVYVGGSGMFTMNGGNISGNRTAADIHLGGGVYVGDSGVFTMNSGNISNNIIGQDLIHYSYGGGVYVGGYGTFIMNGGNISNNIVYARHYSYGGGVYVGGYGTFIMNGGNINNNVAFGAQAPFTLACGGGVSVHDSGTFNMEGGIIRNNNVTGVAYPGYIGGGRGGGVFVFGFNSIFTKNGSAGFIYGIGDPDLANTTFYDGNAYSAGDVVYYMKVLFNNNSADDKRRNTTAGSGVSLVVNKGIVGSGWE